MKRYSNLKRIFALTTLLFLAFSLQAGLVTIEWSWSPADEDITAFRYRLNSQEWVTVDASVTSYVLPRVDEELSFTFEIQQSYDGSSFSGSSSYAYPAGGPAPAQEAAVAASSSPSPEVINEAPVESDDMITVMDEPLIMDEAPVIMDEAPVIMDEAPVIMDEAPVIMDAAPVIMDAAPVIMDAAPVESGDIITVIDEPVVMDEPIDSEIVMSEPAGTEELSSVESADAEAAPEEESVSEIAPLTPPTEAELIESLDSNPKMSIELFAGTGGKGDNVFLTSFFDPDGDYTPLRTMILPSFTFEFVYPGIVTYSPDSYLSFRGGLGFTLYQDTAKDSIVAPDIRAGVSYTRRLNDLWSIDGVAGLSLMFTSKDLSTTEPNLFYGPYVSVIGRYDLSDVLSFAAMAETRFLMSGLFTPYELTGIVRLGVTYRF